jgi:3-oxoacyl-[acyl-carrier-protein] synthase II
MKVYIKGMGNISPQQSWGDETLLSQTLEYKGDRLTCYEPPYEKWIDVRSLRRMSRIIKMGVAAGSMALKEAGVANPDGIITGTGYGCLDDTGTFLTKMVINEEQALNPTPFIQSTHNTIGAQLALLLQCQSYNQTYTQGAFSFESSLLDAVLQLQDNPSQSILVGGVDEITDISHAIQQRFAKFNKESLSSLDLFILSRGTLNGEGASFVVLSGEPGEHDKASLEAITMFYKPDEATLRKGINTFVLEAGLQPDEIDFVLSGACGSVEFDSSLNSIVNDIFPSSSKGFFKHLCGEYPTASSFALWLAARILHAHHVPDTVIFHDAGRPVGNVLIHNQYFGTYHSLILLKSCRAIL